MNLEEFGSRLARAVSTKGSFVPILGFEVSTSPVWADAPPELAEQYGMGSGRSLQAAELQKKGLLTCMVSESLLSDPESRGSDDMVEGLASYLKKFGGDKRKCELPQGHIPELADLQRDVTWLGYALTIVWARSLAGSPRPLGLDFADEPADSAYYGAYNLDDALRSCLDDCLHLWSLELWPAAEPEALKLEWVYEKLLLLAARIFAPQAVDFWQDQARDGFADDHRDFIEAHRRGCGWQWPTGAAVPQFVAAQALEPGVRLSHVLWVEVLRHHCLLAGTRAYRTSEEVAFFLSLDDRLVDLPNVTADPFETGLVYRERISRGSKAFAQDMETLRSLYEYCSSMPDGSPRPPGALHRALAKLVRKSDSQERKLAVPVAPTNKQRPRGLAQSGVCRQVVLSMSLDLEMERAIEIEYPRYRVMVPASVPLKVVEGSDPGAPIYENTWLLGEFEAATSDGARNASKWTLVNELDEHKDPVVELEGEGPLIIKLFGSPLHDIGDTSQFSAGEIDSSNPLPLRHRVVVDEGDLLKRLFNLLPSGVGGLADRVSASDKFFFGQDAVTWSERAPFFMVEAIAGTGSDLEGGEDVSERAITVGKVGLAGDSTLRRLRVSRTEDLVEPQDIAGLIMLKATE